MKARISRTKDKSRTALRAARDYLGKIEVQKGGGKRSMFPLSVIVSVCTAFSTNHDGMSELTTTTKQEQQP